MKSERLIHIKFEYDSAIETKKDILATEIDLLRISQRLKKYRELRLAELEIKGQMDKKLRSMKLDIGRLQNLFPSIQIPKILKPQKEKKQEPIHEEVPMETIEEAPEMSSVDLELQEIQRRLNALQR